MRFRIPDPLFQPLSGVGEHLNPFGSRGSSPRIPQSIPLSPCGGFIGSVLRTLVGRTPLWALPRLNLCLYYIMVGRACQGFFEDFFRGSSNLVFRSISHRKDCAHPLGVPLLGSCGRPSEGLGFASPPDMIIISYLDENVNTFFLSILVNLFTKYSRAGWP